mmetsp:Transcript_24275/g.95545  ORF Transcript_24275/g.95545 Transcript_24275/m.95545 type:complete len:94 (-) Transcript_24275:642-923(-)
MGTSSTYCLNISSSVMPDPPKRDFALFLPLDPCRADIVDSAREFLYSEERNLSLPFLLLCDVHTLRLLHRGILDAVTVSEEESQSDKRLCQKG